jgi:hypothetical protein
MPYIERGINPQEDHSKTIEFRFKLIPNEQDELLSRRKFVKMSMGIAAVLAVGSLGAFGYSFARVHKNVREVESEYPQPPAHEYANAVKEVELYDNKENLYRRCQILATTPETCQAFSPENTTEVQIARSVLEKKFSYERELDKRNSPWGLVGLYSAALTLGSLGRVIYSRIELSVMNSKIRKLERKSNPSRAPQK